MFANPTFFQIFIGSRSRDSFASSATICELPSRCLLVILSITHVARLDPPHDMIHRPFNDEDIPITDPAPPVTPTPQRVSHSLLDPFLTTPLKKTLYPRLPIPRALPPECIVLIGHLSAIAAAFGLGVSTRYWWGGLLGAAGVAGNHIADVLDGTHARATNQCRNGGELLDHFVDPLSFSYYMCGMAASCGRLDFGLAAVIIIYATAVLTSIKAKMTGVFAVAAFGPTEFKSLLVLYGTAMTALGLGWLPGEARQVAFYALAGLLVIGILQLVANLWRAVVEVNRDGEAPDTTEWITRDNPSDSQ